MRATSILLLALATACGSVKERGECSASTECGAGTYCARTPDGNVCWPDAAPPVVSGVTVTCGTPCLRDGTLRVHANVTDDAEVLSAEVALDLATSITVPMQRNGNLWSANVALTRFPMPNDFERGVRVTVRARDGARNAGSMDAAGVTTVTRLRFSKQLDGVVGLTSPAVMQDGTVVVAGAPAKVFFVAWDGSTVSSIAVGSGAISAAPLVLGESVWIGSEDGKFYELTKSGGSWQSTSPCSTSTLRPFRGALAATSSGYVIGGTEYGRLYSATSAGCTGSGPALAPFAFGAVLDESGAAFAAAGTALRRLLIAADGAIEPDPGFSATALPWPVSQPLAVNGAVLVPAVLGLTGRAYRANAAALEPEQIATTRAPTSGYAIAADGSLLVPEAEALARWPGSAADQPIWRTETPGANPRTPLVLYGGQLVASTDAGTVIAFEGDGTIAWSRQLSASTSSLQPANLYTPPASQQVFGAPLSTAYFAAADGYLHAVIVDGVLDQAAPWPKAFHDPRNSNRAGPQP